MEVCSESTDSPELKIPIIGNAKGKGKELQKRVWRRGKRVFRIEEAVFGI